MIRCRGSLVSTSRTCDGGVIKVWCVDAQTLIITAAVCESCVILPDVTPMHRQQSICFLATACEQRRLCATMNSKRFRLSVCVMCVVCVCVCVCEKRSVIIFEEGAGYPAALWEKSSVFLTWIPSLYLGSLGMFGNVNFFLSLPPSQRPESSQKEVLCINNTSSFRLCNKLKIAPILVTVLRLFCSSAALDPWRKSLEMY